MSSIHKKFIEELFRQQKEKDVVPSNQEIAGWCDRLICVMYPQLSTCVLASEDSIEKVIQGLESELSELINNTTACQHCHPKEVAKSFFVQLPEIFRLLQTDIMAILTGDPAAHSAFEVIRAYPGFQALSFYRIAHQLHLAGVSLLPRIIAEQAHSRTGIDIHPAATIGEYCCIDHGTGIVIGETTVIGDRVKIYQGVTLGALSVEKKHAFTKRHPTVEDDVVIYSGATILGGETVIGHHSVVGGNVWLTHSIAPGTLVYHKPDSTVVQPNYFNTIS